MKTTTKVKPSGNGAMTPALEFYQQFGDLVLQFTSQFEAVYNDKGSWARKDAGFWKPIAPQGFCSLGTLIVPNYDDPNGKNWALCIKPAGDFISGTSKPALSLPLGFELIWNDVRSGANQDGSCWRPIAPEGYKALGDVFVSGYDAPLTTEKECPIRCVAEEIVHEGRIGEMLWDDAGSGAVMDMSCYQNLVTDKQVSHGDETLIAVNTFTAVPGYNKPEKSSVCWSLKLPVPVVVNPEPDLPVLDSYNEPPAETPSVVDRYVILPFTAISDRDLTLEEILQRTPFYALERHAYYKKLIWGYNTTGETQPKSSSRSQGITREQSETFSLTTGLTVSYTSGVAALGGEVSVELSLEFGYSSTTSVSQFSATDDIATLNILPQTAAATWAKSNSFVVKRANGDTVGYPLSFEDSGESYIDRQYPLANPGEPRSYTTIRRFRKA